MKKFYRGKTVVITGASSGMGKDLAVLLASFGANVALIARRQSLLDEAQSECQAAGGEAASFVGDVTDADGMARMRDAVLERWGFADIVIANAGVGGLNPGDNFSLDVHRKVVEGRLWEEPAAPARAGRRR